MEDGHVGLSHSSSSFTSATTTRSLQDFAWLEQALRAEFHGALLVPLLSLALYFGPNTVVSNDNVAESGSVDSSTLGSAAMSIAVSQCSLLDGENDNIASLSLAMLGEKMDRNEKVDKNVLADWLSDLLNGVRGQGEVLLNYPIDVVESEAMETFLFRHSEPLKAVSPSQMGNSSATRCRTSILGSSLNIFAMLGGGSDGKEGCKSVFDDFMQNPFECFGQESACADFSGQKKNADKSVASATGNSYYTTPIGRNLPLGSMMCSSGATGVPGIQPCASNLSHMSETDVDYAGFPSSKIATHSELLEAEKELIASHLRSSSSVISKAQSLTRKEAYVGSCWKRFAISLSNLFIVEKNLESANFGDQIKSSKRRQPFRKLRKSAVDDGLRMLARRKMDRSCPGLHALSVMMNAYYADLNSAVPAFKEYAGAIDQLQRYKMCSNQNTKTKYSDVNGSTKSNDGGGDWQSQLEQLKAFTSMKLVDMTKQITGVSGNTTTTSNTSVSHPSYDDDLVDLSGAQTSVLQSRVISNERMLKVSITHLCKTTALRNARIAWLYFKTEAKHASNVHAAATALRQTLSIDADTVIAMRERGYDVKEQEDDAKELDLVRRILELGNHGVGDPDRDGRCQSALNLASGRVGRWNAKIALAIMEAAGVEDAEVQVDETSRELRHARKYAISLRACQGRCIGAAEALSDSVFPADTGDPQISQSRKEFLSALSTVFSGKMTSERFTNGSNISAPSIRVLSSVGIDTSDRGGWLAQERDNSNQRIHQTRRCGDATRYYMKKQDNQANVLISRVLKLLKDYERRLEGIESFVYMHCVGIQLEKHYSRARAKALSAWERKTDISTAINVATKKRIPKLVIELKVKLEALPQVSHTTVIKAKESHLTSKTLKVDLHKLANRRFVRVQEVSTERVIAIMSLWAKHEASVAIEEVKALGEVVQEVEQSAESKDITGAFNAFDLGPESRELHPKIATRSLLI